MNRYEFALFVQHENLTVPFQGEGRKAEAREARPRKHCSGGLLPQPAFLGLSRSPADPEGHCTILPRKPTRFSFSLGAQGSGVGGKRGGGGRLVHGEPVPEAKGACE